MHITIHFFFFFFNDTATTEIYTLSLHDALPILSVRHLASAVWYLLRTTICQWFAEVATNRHVSESSGVDPRINTSLPPACDLQPDTRSISRRRWAYWAATAERWPRPIIRVTSAADVTSASRPTVSTIIATITSTIAKPCSCLIGAPPCRAG